MTVISEQAVGQRTRSHKIKGKGRSERIRAENENAIVKIERGATITQVAQELGMTVPSVCRKLDNAGYTTFDRKRAWRKARVRKEVVDQLRMNRGGVVSNTDALKLHEIRLLSIISHLQMVQNSKPKAVR